MSTFWQRILYPKKKTGGAGVNFAINGNRYHKADTDIDPTSRAEQALATVFCGVGALDPRSPTWAFIRSWAEESLRKAREKNDNINCDPTRTSVLRGEIKMLKELISLPNPKKGLLITDEDEG